MDGAALALLALLCYLGLGQQAVYGDDAYYLVTDLAQGLEHSYHLLYLPLLKAWCAVLGAADIGLFQAMRAASAAGTALGVYASWRAAGQLGMSRRDALLVGALCASAPAVVFFATVIEIHGVFFAFAGGCAIAGARAMRQPSLGRGAVLGTATGLATLVHASGHLLPVLWILVYLADAAAVRRRAVLAALVGCVLLHAGATAAGTMLLQPRGLEAPWQGQTGFLRSWLRDDLSPTYLPYTLWAEWVLPFFPVSLVVWLGARHRGERRRAWLLALAVAVYSGAACVILQDTTERGAYLLPLVLPAALLAARGLPFVAVVAAASLALAFAVHEVRAHDGSDGDPAFGAGVRALAEQGRPFVICRSREETHSLMREAPRIPCVALVTLVRHAEEGGLDYEQFCAGFDQQVGLASNGGHQVYLSRSAYMLLVQYAHPLFRRFALEHLPAHYQLVAERRLGFEGQRLVGR